MKRYIKGMSDTRGNIASILDDNALIVISHIIKLYSYPDNQSKNHWIEEIYSAIHRVKTLKSNHKYPSADFIFKSMWEDSNYRRFDKEYSIIMEDYGESDVSKSYVKSLVLNYLHWLADNLSEYGAVSMTEVKHYLL